MTAVLGIPPPGPVWRCEPTDTLDDLTAVIRVWLTQQETPMADKPLTDREQELDEAAEARIAQEIAEGDKPRPPSETSKRWN